MDDRPHHVPIALRLAPLAIESGLLVLGEIDEIVNSKDASDIVSMKPRDDRIICE